MDHPQAQMRIRPRSTTVHLCCTAATTALASSSSCSAASSSSRVHTRHTQQICPRPAPVPVISQLLLLIPFPF